MLAALALAFAPASALQTITQTAAGLPALSRLVAALASSSGNLLALLNGTTDFTVFAPLDTAFGRPTGSLLSGDLVQTLTYHVIPGVFQAQPLLDAGSLTTVQGQNLTFSGSTANGVFINNYALVTTANIQCSNGWVHLIDTVLISSNTSLVTVAQLAGLTTLASLLTAAGLVPTFANNAVPGAFTVLAPTNAAFATFVGTNAGSWVANPRNVAANLSSLTAVLQYHVVTPATFSRQLTNGMSIPTLLAGNNVSVSISGTPATVSFLDNRATPGAAVVAIADAAAYNGVAHVINNVLVPRTIPVYSALVDIPTLASGQPTLSTLVSALGTAGLVAALSLPAGPFTVLAPNNAAFANVTNLPTGAALVQLLQGHVIMGRLYSTDLRNTTYTTLSGTTVQCVVTAGGVQFIGQGVTENVILADVDSANGVVHVIDRVIIRPPPSPSPAAPSGAAATGASLVALAVAAAAAVAAF